MVLLNNESRGAHLNRFGFQKKEKNWLIYIEPETKNVRTLISMSEIIWIVIGAIIYVVLEVLMIWYVRKKYIEDKSLNCFGVFVHVFLYALNSMVTGVVGWKSLVKAPPMTKYGTIGLVMLVIGLVMTIYCMDFFCKFGTWVGSDVSGLRTNGLYSFSRNPQVVFYTIAYAGFCISWWNIWLIPMALSYIAIMYSMVIIEEEHLTLIFGQEYIEYCHKVPRFIGCPSQ